jgi:hypothetical protein
MEIANELYHELLNTVPHFKQSSMKIVNKYYGICMAYPSQSEQQQCLNSSEEVMIKEADVYIDKIRSVRLKLDSCVEKKVAKDRDECFGFARKEIHKLVEQSKF